MDPGRRVLCLRLGLGLLAFSALLFFKPLEDAYVLPQRLGLTFAALALALGSWDRPLPFSTVFGLGLALFVWRFFCHFCSHDAPAHLPWLAAQISELFLFVGAAVALREPGPRCFAAAALLTAGALGAAYALLAPLGWDPFSGGAVDLGFGRRAHGTLGNPDFLGGWLALLLPPALACALNARDGVRRACLAVAGLLALALLLTFARGAWVAGSAGAAVALAVAGFRPRGRAWLGWAGGLAALVALAAGILSLGPGGFGGLKARVDEAADLHSDAWGSRVFMASVALDLARAHPFTGVGGGAFETEYLERQGERLAVDPDQPFRLTADAHNDWAQAAAETGFPGLLLWAVFFGWALWTACREGGPAGAAVAGALVAFGVQGCFHFPWDIVPSAGLGLLALGASAGFGRVRELPGPRGWPLLAALLLTLCIGLNLRQAEASAFLNSGTSLRSSSGGLPLAAALLRKSAALDPDDERAWSRLGAAQMDQGDPADAVLSYQNALQDLPSSSADWTNLGLCLGMTNRLAGAAEALKQAVRLNPRSNEAWSDEAKVEYMLGHKDAALALARKGIAQAGGSPQAWFNLGGMLYNAGQRAQAASAFEAALRLDPNYPKAAALLAACGGKR